MQTHPHSDDEPFWVRAFDDFFPDAETMTPKYWSTERIGRHPHEGHLYVLVTMQDDVQQKVMPIGCHKRRNAVITIDLTDTGKGQRGWIHEELRLDWIVFGMEGAYKETDRALWFPWITFRRTWMQNKDQWLRQFEHVREEFRHYLLVPVRVVTDAENQQRGVWVPTSLETRAKMQRGERR